MSLKKFCTIVYVVLLFTSIVYSGTILSDDDDDDDHESRVHDHKLSDHDHYTDTDGDSHLEHNSEYDHEAFLGKEEAEKFKHFTPEESQKRLAEIVDKIDVDDNGAVDELELHSWVKSVGKRYIMKDVESRWKAYDKDGVGSFSLDDMLKVNFGALDSWTEEDKENRKEQYAQYMKIMERDKRRFDLADEDKDGRLNKSEYANFLHPEEAVHMRDIIVDETLEDLDKNNDGSIDVEEYIDDLFPDYRKNKNDGDEEPHWIAKERENFIKHRDANGDGKMDRDEVSNWVIPVDYDHSLAEAKHLIYEADMDKDGKLSKEEILNRANLFVASQATAYGDALHDREDL